jgi:hypothetical protein
VKTGAGLTAESRLQYILPRLKHLRLEAALVRAYLKSFILGMTVAIATVTMSESAATLSYDNILGNWCGQNSNPNLTNYLFARDTLTVTFLPDKTTSVLKIDHYDFSDSAVVVYYLAASPDKGSTPGNMLFQVTYYNFGSDGQTMQQKPSDRGGLYRFKRC